MPVVPAMPALRIRASSLGMVGSWRSFLARARTERRSVSSTFSGRRWILLLLLVREVLELVARFGDRAIWADRACWVVSPFWGLRVVKINVSLDEGGWLVRKSSIRRWQIPRPRPLETVSQIVRRLDTGEKLTCSRLLRGCISVKTP
jgi:hypothetical protein